MMILPCRLSRLVDECSKKYILTWDRSSAYDLAIHMGCRKNTVSLTKWPRLSRWIWYITINPNPNYSVYLALSPSWHEFKGFSECETFIYSFTRLLDRIRVVSALAIVSRVEYLQLFIVLVHLSLKNKYRVTVLMNISSYRSDSIIGNSIYVIEYLSIKDVLFSSHRHSKILLVEKSSTV